MISYEAKGSVFTKYMSIKEPWGYIIYPPLFSGKRVIPRKAQDVQYKNMQCARSSIFLTNQQISRGGAPENVFKLKTLQFLEQQFEKE